LPFIYINLCVGKKGLTPTELWREEEGGSSQNYYGRDLAPRRGAEGGGRGVFPGFPKV